MRTCRLVRFDVKRMFFSQNRFFLKNGDWAADVIKHLSGTRFDSEIMRLSLPYCFGNYSKRLAVFNRCTALRELEICFSMNKGGRKVDLPFMQSDFHGPYVVDDATTLIDGLVGVALARAVKAIRVSRVTGSDISTWKYDFVEGIMRDHRGLQWWFEGDRPLAFPGFSSAEGREWVVKFVFNC